MTDTLENSPGPSRSATNTLRGSLRDRRKAAAARLFVDRRVPRLDPPVWVRFQPIPGHQIDKLGTTLSKSKDPEKSVVNNAIALADACLGIYQEALEGEEPVEWLHGKSPDTTGAVGLVSIDPDHDDPVRFDAHLAELLEIPDTGKAVPVVRALYLTDGDIISEAGEVTVWSGFASRDGDEDYSGN